MHVSYFPYKPGGNPYQSLFASALEQGGAQVTRVAPRKLFPLRAATSINCDVIQLDWPHDWYRGNTKASTLIKQIMYRDGLRLLRRRPVVWTAHNLVAHDADDAEFEMRMIQKLVDVSDGIIVMSNRAEAELRAMFSLPNSLVTSVIPHGHYIDVYQNQVDFEAARRKLGVDKNRRLVLSLGRILPYKGLEDLVSDFASLELENSTLIIAGSCSSPGYAKMLKKMAADMSGSGADIRIDAKFIEDDELQFYFNAADAVVLPFRNILNSGSLMLALSFGKRVVAPDIGSIAEVIPEFAWHKYSATDPNGLRDALAAALTSSQQTGEFEARIKQQVEDKFNWQLVGSRALSLYADVASRY